MTELTSLDWWLAAYFTAAGVTCAFATGQFIVKWLLIKFASKKRIDDGLWRLGVLLEIRYGELKAHESITIQGKRFTATVSRTPSSKGSLIKKLSTERTKDR
ncbi:C-type natriuretic protein [Salmonella enterica]|uniref:C-type natriuretic protein n=1 Tax=Salmonella enterica TaxID=28901 RepID=UPI001D643046|nr:C-type natriuretic protein [Salmonella enterica]EHF7992477.1 C-type natriuretic protein [Salmonella enterica subsp. enterica serovar Concord]EHX6951711.1 C-type natriuretic protein [Salmonella enterica subsp. enterica serovar Tennessee]EEU8391228.1 C-type natriuretic protein [Salmonella enterica]EEU8409804.1 C-type natriuretic protein [Salmonella enterica]